MQVNSVKEHPAVMRRTLLVVALFATLALPTLAHADERDFDLINNSTSPISAVFVSPAEDDAWGQNILNENINSGDSRAILFSGELATCIYDLRVEFLDGSNGELRDLDLCATNNVTLDDQFITAN
jgi:hypothetical protein